MADEPSPDDRLVRVLFFAGARELAGQREASFPWAGRSVSQVRADLAGTYGPQFEELLGSCALWVNGRPPAEGPPLEAGDEVAVLPPVSGGCTAVPSGTYGTVQLGRGLRPRVHLGPGATAHGGPAG